MPLRAREASASGRGLCVPENGPRRASAAFACQKVRAPLTVFVMPDRKPGLRPLHVKPSVQPGAPLPAAPSEPVASILLVDDHRPNLLALEAVLDPLRQRLVTAQSGEEALEHLTREEFALILMDVKM